MMAKVVAGEPVVAPYALDDMAADAAGLLAALGIDSAHIVGSSMGGMIAQLVALNHPGKTRSLVSIMSSSGRRSLPPARVEAMQALTTLPKSPSRDDRLATAIAAIRAIGSPGFAATDSELAASLGRSIDRTPFDPPAAARQMAAIVAAPPRHARLKMLTIPALVIHGADDPLVPAAHGEDTAQSIPGAELLIIPGAGHDFNEALTPVYLEAIGAFVARVEAGRQTGHEARYSKFRLGIGGAG